MNLDLGGTIWLNVSPKLLSLHKWFFCKFEDMPREVFEEFKHHSHTHPNATVTSTSTSHDHNVETLYLSAAKACGYSTTTHFHIVIMNVADSHSHSITVSFGSANLGSPNWYNHVHSISLVSEGNGGSLHVHDGTILANRCGVCSPATNHTHGIGTILTANGGGAHNDHTVSGNTGNADSGGTAESHYHPFSLTSGDGEYHRHDNWAGTSASGNCVRGYAHTHNAPSGVTDYIAHTHLLSGNSGTGGEAIAVIPVGGVVQQAKLQDII
jgi:hypothetical protein